MLSVLELFSGCGGLSLGARHAGIHTQVAIDNDPTLTSSYAFNFPDTKLVHADISRLGKSELDAIVPEQVDGILGGPPCQAFSSIGRRDVNDPRRSLVPEFFRIVATVNPIFFLMENVRGLGFAQNRQVLDSSTAILGSEWSISEPVLLDAADFGAPTHRVRLFVFGFNRNLCRAPSLEQITRCAGNSTNVLAAIWDLQNAQHLGRDHLGFDSWAYAAPATHPPSHFAMRMRSSDGRFTGHAPTNHSAETVNRFSTVRQGEVDSVGRHPRLKWDGHCPTLRAGTGRDRGSYQAVRPLHPSEDRVITVREAARLQGFPDTFRFHQTKWHSFRMIGNSVSPIIGETLLRNIRDNLT